MSTKLTELLKGHTAGIYCLINEPDKKIDIRYSVNCNLAIHTLIKEIRQGSKRYKELVLDIDKMEYKIIETFSSIDNKVLKLRHSYWIDHYQELGYTFYRENVIKLIYKLQKVLRNNLFELHLISRSRNKVLVGIFANKVELEEFIDLYYVNGVKEIVYCNNELTKSYYKKKEKVLKF